MGRRSRGSDDVVAVLKKTFEQVSVQRRRMILALILMAEAIVYKILYVPEQRAYPRPRYHDIGGSSDLSFYQ